LYELTLSAALEYFAYNGFARFTIDIRNEDPGTLVGKPFGNRPANAVPGARHDGHFVGKSGHGKHGARSVEHGVEG
jgi:hypothetical protein